MTRLYILLTVILVMVGALFTGHEALARVLTGTGGEDTLVGTDGDDHIKGRAGEDGIKGRGGDDHIKGNRGEDRLDGRSGEDRIKGGRGEDTIEGSSGKDKIIPGKGEDEVDAGAGDDHIIARDTDGVDHIDCGDGFDVVETIHRDDKTKRNCERVPESGAGTTTSTTRTTTGTTAGTPGTSTTSTSGTTVTATGTSTTGTTSTTTSTPGTPDTTGTTTGTTTNTTATTTRTTGTTTGTTGTPITTPGTTGTTGTTTGTTTSTTDTTITTPGTTGTTGTTTSTPPPGSASPEPEPQDVEKGPLAGGTAIGKDVLVPGDIIDILPDGTRVNGIDQIIIETENCQLTAQGNELTITMSDRGVPFRIRDSDNADITLEADGTIVANGRSTLGESFPEAVRENPDKLIVPIPVDPENDVFPRGPNDTFPIISSTGVGGEGCRVVGESTDGGGDAGNVDRRASIDKGSTNAGDVNSKEGVIPDTISENPVPNTGGMSMLGPVVSGLAFIGVGLLLFRSAVRRNT
jgi:hypothetical protein